MRDKKPSVTLSKVLFSAKINGDLEKREITAFNKIESKGGRFLFVSMEGYK